LKSWDEIIVNDEVAEKLETEILPAYLPKTNWFAGRQRTIFNCKVAEHINITLGRSQIILLMLEVNYKTGLPENYFLPISFLKNQAAEDLLQESPQSILGKMKLNGKDAVLVDALYTIPLQRWLFEKMAGSETISFNKFSLDFTGGEEIKKYFEEHHEIRSRIVNRTNHTAVTYDNHFFLKIYRKVEMGINPDQELCYYLSQQKFVYTPECLGEIEWKFRRGNCTIGTMQRLVENHGDGYGYMKDRINNYIERIVARKGELEKIEWKGSLLEPASFENLSTELQDLLGARASDQSRLFGARVGELHLTLQKATTLKDFSPEHFSLHYQRSLFSAAAALVRESYNSMQQHKKSVPENEQTAIENLLGRKNEMLGLFKKIYRKKFDVVKTRIHGSLGLGQLLLTGKDVAIHDFEGYATRSYSETRLKRSPLLDVASMIRSYYYAGYEAFLSSPHFKNGELKNLLQYSDLWIHYMGGFFLKAWLAKVKETNIIPSSPEDLRLMLQHYLLEKALLALNYEISNRPEKVIIPLAMVRDILD
jgi:maltose alpha-D-glucosyltransferase / alpha-amylase